MVLRFNYFVRLAPQAVLLSALTLQLAIAAYAENPEQKSAARPLYNDTYDPDSGITPGRLRLRSSTGVDKARPQFESTYGNKETPIEQKPQSGGTPVSKDQNCDEPANETSPSIDLKEENAEASAEKKREQYIRPEFDKTYGGLR